MHTLIIGLGNPILGDDGVGWHVAREVSRLSGIPLGDAPLPAAGRERAAVSIECYSLAGLSLMERIVGYERVILIDALNTGQRPQGEVITFRLDELPDLTHGHSASAHDVSLKYALKMGRSLGAILPDDKDVIIVAIEAEHVYNFIEHLSPTIGAAVPAAVQAVLDLLDQTTISNPPQEAL